MYVGRFAPSPTGPLHFGSLATALASYCIARQAAGRWQLRIEDIDPPRNPVGIADEICRVLAQHGFRHDGDISHQSQHSQRYEAALTQLKQQDLLFACRCSRKQLSSSAPVGALGPIYPGTCRTLNLPEKEAALRLRVGTETQVFIDAHYGTQRQNLARELGDFVLKRRDGLYAYQLAVVCDDAAEGVTHVVRGFDILDNTARQRFLQQCLGLPTLEYLHLPLLVQSNGQKLSKQNHAPAIDPNHALENLLKVWTALGQLSLPHTADVDTFWRMAIPAWQTKSLPAEHILFPT